jgi:hypothetical protein
LREINASALILAGLASALILPAAATALLGGTTEQSRADARATQILGEGL